MVEGMPDKSFMLQKQAKISSRQPLEVYHLSHDLRGPLNSILGFAELLVEGVEGPLNDIQTEDINAIYQSAKTLLTLINIVVDLSKLEAGRLNLDFEPVQLAQVVGKVVTGESIKASPVIVDVPGSLPALSGAGDRIEQMVFNLIDFALKVKNVKEVRVLATPSPTDVTMQVIAVEGVMKAEELEDLFDLTVAVDETGRSKLTKGGLQMPLTQKLAVAHHGRVWVDIQAGTGVIFNLQLPLHRLD